MKYYVRVIGGHLVKTTYTNFNFESKIKSDCKWNNLNNDLIEEVITFFKEKDPLAENVYVESIVPAYWGYVWEYLDKDLEIPKQLLESFKQSKKELYEEIIK